MIEVEVTILETKDCFTLGIIPRPVEPTALEVDVWEYFKAAIEVVDEVVRRQTKCDASRIEDKSDGCAVLREKLAAMKKLRFPRHEQH